MFTTKILGPSIRSYDTPQNMLKLRPCGLSVANKRKRMNLSSVMLTTMVSKGIGIALGSP